MAWKCKECGKVVLEIEINKYSLNKDKDREKLYSDKYYYKCTNCDNCTFDSNNYTDVDIEDIAYWEDDK